MQLYSLDTNYAPKDLIEGYSSLIWTERYRETGEISLTTPLIADTVAALPLRSLVGIAESEEVMIIEKEEIQDNDQGETELVVTGTSFENFFRNRPAIPSLGGLVDGSGNDITWNITNLKASYVPIWMMNKICRDGILSSADIIPNWISSPFVSKDLEYQDWKIQRGTLYDRVKEILDQNDLGIRQKRPLIPNDPLQTYIYDGSDKSSTVIMDVTAGHLTNARYLLSIENYLTGTYASCKNNGYAVYFVGGNGGTGLDRRMGLFDASDLTDPTPSTPYFLEFEARARSYIADHRLIKSFDGAVAVDNPYKFGFNKDYFLGDLVYGIGEYGVRQKLQVREYIRVEDQDGESAYPTLDLPSS